MNVMVRVGFMIVWVVYGRLIIDIYIKFNNDCFQSTDFAKEIKIYLCGYCQFFQ